MSSHKRETHCVVGIESASLSSNLTQGATLRAVGPYGPV